MGHTLCLVLFLSWWSSTLATTRPSERSLYIAPANTSDIKREVRPVDDLLPIGSTCIQQNDIIPDGTLLSTTPIYAPTFAACCNACASAARCNVFAFCPVGAGNCTIPPGSVGAGTYNETACMLMYQQSLEIPGNGIKAATYSTNVVINFVAGAPIVATAANVSVDGYRVYAYAHMPNAVGTLRTCGAAANATCQLSGVSQEEAAAACDDTPNCFGFDYLPSTNTSRLLGLPAFNSSLQLRLLLNNRLQQSPTAELFLADQPLPSAQDFAEATKLMPAAALSSNIDDRSGCLIEPHTQYRGSEVATLFNISSAVDCCALCERRSQCNVWNYCGYPTGCNLTDIMGTPMQSLPPLTCRLLQSEIVLNGKYPSVVRQDGAEPFTSGLPPTEVKRMASMYATAPRPNARSSNSSGCLTSPNTLFAGLVLNASIANQQPSLEACCDSCRNNTQCNAMAWCPTNTTGGCRDADLGIASPPGTCRLMYSGTVAIACPAMPAGAETPRAIFGKGPSVAWSSGTPIRIANTTVEGYTLTAFANFKPPMLGDNLNCSGPTPDPLLMGNRCRYEVPSIQDAAQLCSATQGCEMFMWLPYGDLATDEGYERGVTYLKGNFSTPGGVLGAIANATMPNPSVGIYIANPLLGIPASSSSSSSSSSSTALIVGLAVGLGGLALILVAALAALLLRRRQVAEDERYAPLSVALKRADELHCSGSIATQHKGGSDDGSLSTALEGKSSMAASNNADTVDPPHSRDSDRILGGVPEGTVTASVMDAGSWEVQPGELTVCKDVMGKDVVLGKGGFSTVFKAKYQGGMYCAVKQMMVAPTDPERMRAVHKEVAILRGVRSPYVVQFLGACQLPDRFLLVTELMEGGSLWTALQRNRVTWTRRGPAVALDVALGLHYLHSRNTLHLDLKSANVLLDRNGRAKIADVGVAQIRADTYVQNVDAGTYAWAAPEVLMGERVGPAADIFSFGVLLHELVTGEEPVRGCLRPVRVPEDCSQEIADLIRNCMASVGGERPQLDAVINVLRAAVKGGREPADKLETWDSKFSGAASG